MEGTVTARADALAAADEGVHRNTRGGCAPQRKQRLEPGENRFEQKNNM